MATPQLAAAIMASAQRLGISPKDLATVISYETGGTFDPWQAGPTTQWGQHRGLIQWGEPQRQKYGVTQDMPVEGQMGAVEKYLTDAGVRPGMGLMDVYSAVNAGHVGRNNASDANNGGAPGTVADKVNNQMGDHAAKAEQLLALAQAQGQAPAPEAPMQLAGAAPAYGADTNQVGLLAQTPQATQGDPFKAFQGLLAPQQPQQQEAPQRSLLAPPQGYSPLQFKLAQPQRRRFA